ncbi:Osiris 9F [Operophtera brumata]|uniref:Osiris 9F n=1 Tax=Operophtera brumata TaxID=104452 RepID=A0A0L7L0S9_OPEBR|nr:Osiris 9F [Operophtera brumata]
MKVFVLVLGVLAVVQSNPVSQDENVLKSVIGSLSECVNSDVDLCLKEHALKAADRLSSARKLKIFEGVTLLNNAPRESRSFEALSDLPDVRNQQLTERLWKTSGDLIQGGEIELTYGGEDEDESRAIGDVEEGRGKKKKMKKKLKMLIPLLMIAKAKAVAIAILALVIIAASILKLAILAKVAFIIKIIAIIKALLAAKKHHQEETWEIAPAHGWEAPHHGAEHHVEHGHGWEGGWSRRGNDGNNLAYSAYNN